VGDAGEGGEFSPGRLREDETPRDEPPEQHSVGTAKPFPPGDVGRDHQPGGKLFAFGISSATGTLSPPPQLWMENLSLWDCFPCYGAGRTQGDLHPAAWLRQPGKRRLPRHSRQPGAGHGLRNQERAPKPQRSASKHHDTIRFTGFLVPADREHRYRPFPCPG